ncbi:MAG: HIT family protein [Actinomycetota bacterium]
MAYIKGSERFDGCVFCALLSCGNDEDSLILKRGALAFVVLNKFPYNTGHAMVVPNRHIDSYEKLTLEEHAEIASLVSETIEALHQTHAPQGFNIGVNQGHVAGAGIADHVHTHVVPRWSGDTNFMPVIGETKVLPESLGETYEKLKTLL